MDKYLSTLPLLESLGTSMGLTGMDPMKMLSITRASAGLHQQLPQFGASGQQNMLSPHAHPGFLSLPGKAIHFLTAASESPRFFSWHKPELPHALILIFSQDF